MFKYRFQSILKLRENERDEARGLVAEAYEAIRQIESRREDLTAERTLLSQNTIQRRAGTLLMDRLLADGRYDMQLASDDAQLVVAKEKIELELHRRQQVLTNANAAVRQLEILREKEILESDAKQLKIAQRNLDEIAARRSRLRAVREDDEDAMQAETWSKR